MNVRREAELRQVPRVPEPRPVAPQPWPRSFLDTAAASDARAARGTRLSPPPTTGPKPPPARPRAPHSLLSPWRGPEAAAREPDLPPLPPGSRRRPRPAGPRPARRRPRWRLTKKRGALRSPAGEGPGAGGRLGQAVPRTGPLGQGLWLLGPERWPPPAAPPPRTLQARGPTLCTARRVRSASLAAAHPPKTPAPPPAAAAVRSVNIPASPRRGRSGRRHRPHAEPRPRALLWPQDASAGLRGGTPRFTRWSPGGSGEAVLWSGRTLLPSFRQLPSKPGVGCFLRTLCLSALFASGQPNW